MVVEADFACRKSRSWATAALLIISACAAISPPQIDGIRCERGAVVGAKSTTLMVFAGWKVTANDAWHWGTALAAAGFAADPPAMLCAARGPQDAGYKAKDIETGAFAAALIANPPGGEITVIAHSSGSFVAQHLFRQLRDSAGSSILARIHYINLDGAVGEGERAIDAEMIAALASIRAVYAMDPNTSSESANSSSMRRLHALAPGRVTLMALPVPDAGCNKGAQWCLHNALINRRPYNPASFDLKRDYGEINAAHPVEVAYLRAR
jgi:pimeloyl-ACP methyl ester carboxylesterase